MTDVVKDFSPPYPMVCTFEVTLKGSFSVTKLKNVLSKKQNMCRFSFSHLRCWSIEYSR